MSAMTNSQPQPDPAAEQPRRRLGRHDDAAHQQTLARLLDERDEMPRLDVAAFNSSI